VVHEKKITLYSDNIKCTKLQKVLMSNGIIESGTTSHSAWEWKRVSSEGLRYLE